MSSSGGGPGVYRGHGDPAHRAEPPGLGRAVLPPSPSAHCCENDPLHHVCPSAFFYRATCGLWG